MRDEKHKYPLEWYKYNLLESRNMWLLGPKYLSKSGFLGVKWVYWGLKKIGLPTKLERQNGAKCGFCS